MRAAALALALGCIAQDEPAPRGGFEDPAPPTVAALEPVAAPAPVAPPELTRRAAPAPLADGARTEDWPGFLGPRRDGRSLETGLALEFDLDGPPLVWELARGEGYAAPAVADGRLVFTHREGALAHVDCLVPETGERLWRRSFPCDYEPRYVRNGGPRATPMIAGGRVYVHGVQGRLSCLELATGRTVWERDTKAEFAVPDGFFGVVSSPLVRDDLLVQIIGGARGPSVAAFDAATGALAWGAGTKWGMDCASPVVAELRGRARVLAVTGGESRPPTGGLIVADLATGAVELELPFRSRTYASVNAACATVVGERAFLTASYNTGSAGVGLDEGGAWQELWRSRRVGVQFVNPVAVDGRVWVVEGTSDRAGALACVDPSSGEVLARTDLVWDEELDGRTRAASVGEASLLFVQDRLLCLGDNGHLLTLRFGPEETEIVARASLFRARETWTPLALSRGLLYVCQNEPGRGGTPRRLLCYDLRAR